MQEEDYLRYTTHNVGEIYPGLNIFYHPELEKAEDVCYQAFESTTRLNPYAKIMANTTSHLRDNHRLAFPKHRSSLPPLSHDAYCKSHKATLISGALILELCLDVFILAIYPLNLVRVSASVIGYLSLDLAILLAQLISTLQRQRKAPFFEKVLSSRSMKRVWL